MRLLKLELKRMLKTRVTLILLLAALGLSVLLAWLPVTYQYALYLDDGGNLVELHGMEALKHLKAAQAGVSGPVTTEKVRTALESYQAVLRKYGVTETYDLPDGVYDTEILPYSAMLRGIRELFANPNTGVAPSLMDIDPAEIDDYYGLCDARLDALMKLEQPDHPAAWQGAKDLFSQVTKPYLFTPGYHTDALDYQVFLGFLILCICAVIAVPTFTSDYQTGADDILRCTKYGKEKLALVKVLSVFLICGLTAVLSGGIYILVSDSLFGWESTKTSVQLLYSITNLVNANVFWFQVLTAAASLLSILATVSALLFLSARCRNMIVAVSGALGFCVLPIVVYMALPSPICEWVYSLIPSSGAGIQTSWLFAAIDYFYLHVGQTSLWLPHMMIGACILEIPLFLGLTVRSYVKHSV